MARERKQPPDGEWLRATELGRRVNRTDVWAHQLARKNKIRRMRDSNNNWVYSLEDAQRCVDENSPAGKAHLPQMIDHIRWVLDGYELQEIKADEACKRIRRIISSR
jgi:hypothetical protein